MSKPRTHVIFLLDKSGSMGQTKQKKEQAITDYNEKVTMYQSIEAEGEQELICYFCSFNHECFEHLWSKPAKEMQLLTEEFYQPSGGTALRDSVAYVLSKALEHIKLDEKDAILVNIFTDGQDLDSRQWSEARLKVLIQDVEKTGKWTISYIGPAKNSEVIQSLGLQLGNCAVYDDSSVEGTKMANRHYNRRTMGYFAARAKGATAVSNLCSDDGKLHNFSEADPNTCAPPAKNVLKEWANQVSNKS